jgi:hypothetical protein
VLLLLKLLVAAVAVSAATCAAVGILPMLVLVLRVVQHATPVAAVTW